MGWLKLCKVWHTVLGQSCFFNTIIFLLKCTLNKTVWGQSPSVELKKIKYLLGSYFIFWHRRSPVLQNRHTTLLHINQVFVVNITQTHLIIKKNKKYKCYNPTSHSGIFALQCSRTATHPSFHSPHLSAAIHTIRAVSRDGSFERKSSMEDIIAWAVCAGTNWNWIRLKKSSSLSGNLDE